MVNHLDCLYVHRTCHSKINGCELLQSLLLMQEDNFFSCVCVHFSWKEWVTLPVQYSDLPRTAMLALTILDCAGAGKMSVIGGTTISMFGKNGMFRQVGGLTIGCCQYRLIETHFYRECMIFVFGQALRLMVIIKQQHPVRVKILVKIIRCNDSANCTRNTATDKFRR